MQFLQLVRKSLVYYWRTNLAVGAGVTTAVAVVTGALIVGASVRASLLDLALHRLGRTDQAITSNHLFRDQLSAELASAARVATCPLIHLRGVLTHEASGL